MAFRFSIGIVTYLGRFDTYFKPLLQKLIFSFPDYDIIIFLNGHYNLEKQIDYLQRATSLLSQYPQVRYLTNIHHQPLAQAWNWLILMAACDHILILNDDVTINPEMRHRLERLNSVPDICTINRSWSHFLIHKNVVRQAGWFDENFKGIGYEDYDYIFRLARKGIQVKNLEMHGILNYTAPSTDASWADISDSVHSKYSKINYDYFMQKWAWSEYGEVPASRAFKVHYEPYGQDWLVSLHEPQELPYYYPRESLHFPAPPRQGVLSALKGLAAQAISFINSSYWTARLNLASWLRTRGLLGPWWEKLKACVKK